MANSKESSIQSLYVELNRFGQNGEYERALKTANKILNLSNYEVEAFHGKIVCLIQMGKFNDALKLLLKETKISGNLIFEKSYCQYRLNQPLDALKTVETANQSNLSLKLKELKAQILYRLERYEECFETYRDIIKNSNDDYEDERETNLSAVIANLYVESPKQELPHLRENTYELAYNSSCQLISKGLYSEAEKKLKTCEKLCRESLEEDGTAEEDVDSELGIIKVQLAYCLQMQGREKEAQVLYSNTLRQKPDDIGLVAIVSNNLVTLNKDQNVFDSKKKMKSATVDGLEFKLTSKQRRSIALNQCLLSVRTNQPNDQCDAMCNKLVTAHPEFAPEAALMKAIRLSKDGKAQAAADYLREFSGKNPEQNLSMKLAAVQLLLLQGERREACKVLHSLGDQMFKPGIISALVSLYLFDDCREEASNVLKAAVDWYKKKKVNAGDLSLLWRQAADFHLRAGEPNIAAKSLEELLKINPGDKKTLAQLVIAYSQFDPEKAKMLSKQLPLLDLSQGTDVNVLESSNWIMGTKVIKKAAAKVEASPKPGTGEELLQKKKAKRKRKAKLSKNFDPNATPDPERWLPRHERSGYRRKKDRRFKEVVKGTQGAASRDSEIYDMSKAVNQSKGTPSSPAQAISGPRQHVKKLQLKKKKKNSTKW